MMKRLRCDGVLDCFCFASLACAPGFAACVSCLCCVGNGYVRMYEHVRAWTVLTMLSHAHRHHTLVIRSAKLGIKYISNNIAKMHTEQANLYGYTCHFY